MATLRIAFLSALVLELLATSGVALVAVGVGLRLVYGEVTLTAGLTALLLAPEVFWPLRRVGVEFHAAQDGRTAADAALRLVEHCRADRQGRTVRAKGATIHLGALDADVKPGRVTVLTGPNGAGKTTLLHTILALHPGQVSVDGIDVDDLDLRAWWRQVSWLPHRPVLVPGSVRHNLELFGPLPDPDFACCATGFDEVLMSLPDGLDTVLGRDGTGLSLGQRQRLGLARALGSAAPVLLLDEPTSHLDAAMEARVLDAIVGRARRRHRVVVGHREPVRAIGDRMVSVGIWSMRELLRPRLGRLSLAVLLGVLSLGSALALAAISAWLITRAWQMPPVLDLTIAVVAVRASASPVACCATANGWCRTTPRCARRPTPASAMYAGWRTRRPTPRRGCRAVSWWPGSARSIDDFADVLVRAVLPIAVAACSAAAVDGIAHHLRRGGDVLARCLLVAGVCAPAVAVAPARRPKPSPRHIIRAATWRRCSPSSTRRSSVSAAASPRSSPKRTADNATGRALDRAAVPTALSAAASTAAIGVSVFGAVIAGIGSPTLRPDHPCDPDAVAAVGVRSTTALPAAAVQLTRSRIAARRLAELTAPIDSPRERPTSPDVTLAARDRLAIVGPSGAGKTTLLLSIAETHSSAVFFAEDAHIFATTVRDNMLVARGDASDDEIRIALRRVGLGDWLDALPEGLSTVLTGGAAAVSAGQRRRLLLARALLTTAETVLLDEPTEHLDAADGSQMLTELLTPGGLFPADRTVVVATHHLPEQLECPTLILGARGVTSSA